MTAVSTAILLLARLPEGPAALREFEDLANTLTNRWQQVVIPCPVAGADDVLFAVRSALAQGVERIVALPLLVPIVTLREWKVAEQFRVLGRRFTGVTFHMAQAFGPTDAAQALAENVRERVAQSPEMNVEHLAVILVDRGPTTAIDSAAAKGVAGAERLSEAPDFQTKEDATAAWETGASLRSAPATPLGPGLPKTTNRKESAAELAGLARLTFEFGAGVTVDYAVGAGLNAVRDRQARLGVRHILLAAGELFTIDATELPMLPPFWRRETVLRQLEERWQTALKDQSLVPQVWDEVAREIHAPEEEAALLRDLNAQIALLPPTAPSAQEALLQPALPEAIAAASEAYRAVLAEIERGLQTVTGRPTVPSKAPGWVGVSCETEEMAVWLLRAVIVENVMVRREGSVLYLPAGPDYQAGDIRRLVGVVGRAARYFAQRQLRTCS